MSSFSFSVRRFFSRGAGNQHRCLNILLILLNEDENPLGRKKEVALSAAVADANVSDANHGKADFDGFLMEVRSIKRNASSCNVTEKSTYNTNVLPYYMYIYYVLIIVCTVLSLMW